MPGAVGATPFTGVELAMLLESVGKREAALAVRNCGTAIEA